MTYIKNIYNYINDLAPFDTAMDFDNVGLLIGNFNKRVSNVLLSLDITSLTIKEAKKLNAELIISHHPAIFNPLKSIDTNSIIYKLIREDISAICAHTNLDMAPKGVNTYLAKKINLNNISPLSFYNNIPCALKGNLSDKISPSEFAEFVKSKLRCEGLKFIEGDKEITTVGLCSGSGGSYIHDAIKNNIDAFLTGEVRHHEWLLATDYGITLIEAGHFKSENIIIEPLRNMLRDTFPDVLFTASKTNTDFVKYI